MANIWEKITTVTTPTWTSVSEITTPSWSAVTISNSITYKESDGPTPSIDGIFDWEDISTKWEIYGYEWGKLVT